MNKYVKTIGMTSGVALFTLILSNQAAMSAGCIEGSCTGYTKTAAQCQGKDAIRCPFDTSKYFCANDTCTDEQEWCETSQSYTPTCNGYKTVPAGLTAACINGKTKMTCTDCNVTALNIINVSEKSHSVYQAMHGVRLKENVFLLATAIQKLKLIFPSIPA